VRGASIGENVDMRYVAHRNRRSDCRKSCASNAERQESGNDDASPDVHDSSQAIPQVSSGP
jgi:hypothetical protein